MKCTDIISEVNLSIQGSGLYLLPMSEHNTLQSEIGTLCSPTSVQVRKTRPAPSSATDDGMERVAVELPSNNSNLRKSSRERTAVFSCITPK